MKSTCILLKNVSSWHVVVLAGRIDISGYRYGSVYGRRMARLSCEVLWLSYQGGASQVFILSVFNVIKEPHMISEVQCFNS